MRLTLGAITLMLLVLAAAATASADSVPLQLMDGGNDVMAGVYVGPYNFVTTGNVPLHLICDDYIHDVYPGESWTANTSTLPPLGSNLQFPGGSLTQYEEVSWLAQQIFALYPVTPGNAATIGYMQYAIWDIFTCGASGLASATCASAGFTGTDLAGVTTWYNNALSEYATGNYSDVVIYTPASNGIPQGTWPQEYIGIRTPAPEPGSLMLIVTGLAGLATQRRRFLN
jgi:hypothetical protein